MLSTVISLSFPVMYRNLIIVHFLRVLNVASGQMNREVFPTERQWLIRTRSPRL